MDFLDTLTRDELLRLARMYAKNWLAHDGSWFLAAEEAHGLETAIDLDTKAWERFAAAEAKRIMREFNIPSGGGLKGLEEAFQYRLYAALNPQKMEWPDDSTLIFRMLDCRVQSARRQKDLPDFPCKSVGLVEFSTFARTVDPRIRTRCIACPPDTAEGFACAWEFTLSQSPA